MGKVMIGAGSDPEAMVRLHKIEDGLLQYYKRQNPIVKWGTSEAYTLTAAQNYKPMTLPYASWEFAVITRAEHQLLSTTFCDGGRNGDVIIYTYSGLREEYRIHTGRIILPEDTVFNQDTLTFEANNYTIQFKDLREYS